MHCNLCLALNRTPLGISGTLPSTIGDMISLEILDLSGNMRDDVEGSGLIGGIPSEIGYLASSLRQLILHGNDMDGPLPTEIGMLSDLEVLHLKENGFNVSSILRARII